jgi:hypothetical protein
MNLGAGKSPMDVIKKDDDVEEESLLSGGKKKGKKKFASAGVTASTIGTKCRNLRLPVHRLGRGFVVIIHSGARPDEVQNRLDLLKVRFGVNEIKIDAVKKEDEIKTVAQKALNNPVVVQPGLYDVSEPEFRPDWDQYDE